MENTSQSQLGKRRQNALLQSTPLVLKVSLVNFGISGILSLIFGLFSANVERQIVHTQQTGAPFASSATKELDDLMASLSDFKVSSLPIVPRFALIPGEETLTLQTRRTMRLKAH